MGVAFRHVSQGAEIRLEYRDNNLRVNEFFWTIPDGLVGYLRIWDADDAFDSLLSGSGSVNVPGSLAHRLEVVDDGLGDTYLGLPEGAGYRFEVRSA